MSFLAAFQTAGFAFVATERKVTETYIDGSQKFSEGPAKVSRLADGWLACVGDAALTVALRQRLTAENTTDPARVLAITEEVYAGNFWRVPGLEVKLTALAVVRCVAGRLLLFHASVNGDVQLRTPPDNSYFFSWPGDVGPEDRARIQTEFVGSPLGTLGEAVYAAARAAGRVKEVSRRTSDHFDLGILAKDPGRVFYIRTEGRLTDFATVEAVGAALNRSDFNAFNLN